MVSFFSLRLNKPQPIVPLSALLLLLYSVE